MKRIAHVISYAFLPPVNLVLIFIISAFYIYDNPIMRIITISIALVFGFIMPILIFTLLRLKGKIIDNDASKRNERTIPYIMGAFLILFAGIISIYLELHQFIIALWLSYLIASILLISINNFWKISAHAMGAAIPFAVLLFILGNIAYYFIIIPLLIGWARIYLDLHSISQVLIGLLVGYSITLLILNYSLKIM